MVATCEQCNTEYHRKPSKVGKYCGMDCYGASKKGTAPWNKGKKTGHAPWLGKKRSQETIDKIKKTKRENPFHHSDETKKIISKHATKNASTYKGDEATYWSKHDWVRYHKGAAQKCEDCGRTNKETVIHWSNVDHKYRRVLEDYVARCPRCHKKYDLQNELCSH